MKYSRLWVLAAIIAVAILVSFVFSVPRTRDTTKIEQPNVETSVPVVLVRDSFKKGVHTITGSFTVPNACTTLTATTSLVGDELQTTGILVELSVPEDSGICLQVSTRESFSTTISAPAGLPIRVTVNGTAATTTPS